MFGRKVIAEAATPCHCGLSCWTDYRTSLCLRVLDLIAAIAPCLMVWMVRDLKDEMSALLGH